MPNMHKLNVKPWLLPMQQHLLPRVRISVSMQLVFLKCISHKNKQINRLVLHINLALAERRGDFFSLQSVQKEGVSATLLLIHPGSFLPCLLLLSCCVLKKSSQEGKTEQICKQSKVPRTASSTLYIGIRMFGRQKGWSCMP